MRKYFRDCSIKANLCGKDRKQIEDLNHIQELLV